MRKPLFKNQRQRIIALFFLFTFLNTLVPYNLLYASGNGPTAPEATGFEPVDATDMVNLNSGGFTYVLPLMNVPSPEGGYPISMGYHAGISVDQTASWVGMGWTLNPGAINRSVNGYPDDYNNVEIADYFYDEGETQTSYSLSAGYSLGAVSVGLGMSWGSHQATSGYVSAGIGFTLEGTKIGVGINASVGINQASSIGASVSVGVMSFGVSANSDGGASVNAGVSSKGNNSVGMSVGASTDGTYSVGVSGSSRSGDNSSKASLGVSFSKDGISRISVNASSGASKKDAITGQKSYHAESGGGISMNFAQSHALDMGDFVNTSSMSNFGIVVPTPIGVFSLGYSKSQFKYALGIERGNFITGPLHFDENSRKYFFYKADLHHGGGGPSSATSTFWFDGNSENEIISKIDDKGETLGGKYSGYRIRQKIEYTPQQDILAFPIEEYGLGKVSHLLANNITLPAYDSYNVQAQGLSGTIKSYHYENAALFGQSDQSSQLGHTGNYDVNSVNSGIEDHFKFNNKPEFEFDNEITSFLETTRAKFGTSTDQVKPSDYFDETWDDEDNTTTRGHTANYVEYYTYKDINKKFELENGERPLLTEGFLFSDAVISESEGVLNNALFSPPGAGTNLNALDSKIAAFKITAMDGKTYHYSLPVHNFEVITRTIGQRKDGDTPKPEKDSYMEKRQLSPFATHWLLTAVTGPDFIDVNANGTADVGDYGYWTRFEYGKWTDAFIWKTPYNEDYIVDMDDPDIKTYIRGRKEVFYLNKIKTRTHTAVFEKSPTDNSDSVTWEYSSTNHVNIVKPDDNNDSYDWKFTVPQQQSLKLDNIYLFKNEDDNISASASTFNNSVNINNYRFENSALHDEISIKRRYNENVITSSDISATTKAKAIKVVELNHLNVPNNHAYKTKAESLLSSIEFKGKGNSDIMPPYRFDYHDFIGVLGDDWGYHRTTPEQGSLNKITTPTGGVLEIEYEPNSYYKPMIDKGRQFNSGLTFSVLSLPDENMIAKKYMYPEPLYRSFSPREAPKTTYRLSVRANFDLSNYFEVDKNENNMYVDIWLYMAQNRDGTRRRHVSTLDVLPQFAKVISMSSSKRSMEIEVEGSSPYFRDEDNQGRKSSTAHSYYYGYLLNSTDPSYQHQYFRDDNTGPAWKEVENQHHGRYDVDLPGEPGGSSSAKRYSLQYTLVGNKKAAINSNGGGIRVKSITSKEEDEGKSYQQEYDYSYAGEIEAGVNDGQTSSGSLSYIPHEYNEHIPYSSQLPAPRVMYEYVTLKQEDGSSTQYHFNVMNERTKGKLNFSDFYKVEEDSEDFYNEGKARELTVTDFTIQDNLAGLGSMLSTKHYNSEDQLLSEDINTYFSFDELEASGLGVKQESYQMYKTVDYMDWSHEEAPDDSEGKWFVTSSTRKRYPSLLKSTTIISGGQKITTEFLDFDEVSGQAQKIRTYNALGEELITESKAAFHISEYDEMGSKKDNPLNKHMLSQSAYTVKKHIDINGAEHVLSADITTWNNEWTYKDVDGTNNTMTIPNFDKVWRKHKEFTWTGPLDGNGYYSGYTDTENNPQNDFDWSIGVTAQTNVNWQETSHNTLYNKYSKLLEVKDINGNYASTKMCDNNTKTLAVSNSKYEDMHYANAEYSSVDGYFAEGIPMFGERTNEKSHTGTYSFKTLWANAPILITRVPGSSMLKDHRSSKFDRKYKVSVWVNQDQVVFDENGEIESLETKVYINNNEQEGVFKYEAIKAGDWVLLNGEIQIPDTDVFTDVKLYSTSANNYYDDFRMYPISSSMTSYVYNEWDELSYIIGDNGLATRYVYGEGGRLTETWVEVLDLKPNPTEDKYKGGFKRVSKNEYHYKNQD